MSDKGNAQNYTYCADWARQETFIFLITLTAVLTVQGNRRQNFFKKNRACYRADCAR